MARLSGEERQALVEAYEEWDTVTDGPIELLADRFNISRNSLYQNLRKMGVTPKSHRYATQLGLPVGSGDSSEHFRMVLDELAEARTRIQDLQDELAVERARSDSVIDTETLFAAPGVANWLRTQVPALGEIQDLTVAAALFLTGLNDTDRASLISAVEDQRIG